jgi:hypothetical protein
MEPIPEPRKIELDQKTVNYLNTTRKWTMFLAITGFIFFAVLIIFLLATGSFLTVFNSGTNEDGLPVFLLLFLVILVIVVYFFPLYFLYQFSKHTANAVSVYDKRELHKAINNLRLFFVFLGVLTIFILTIYLLVLIIALFSLSYIKGL